MPDARKLLPSCLSSTCADGSFGDVSIYDFVPQLATWSVAKPGDHDTAELVGHWCKFSITANANAGRVLGESLVSGSVYSSDAYARYITQQNRQLFVLIIQWIDGMMSVTGNDHFLLKPYSMFTPAIVLNHFGAQSKPGQAYHGSLPKVRLSSPVQNQIQCHQGDPIRCKYHNQHLRVSKAMSDFWTNVFISLINFHNSLLCFFLISWHIFTSIVHISDLRIFHIYFFSFPELSVSYSWAFRFIKTR